jgi:hypothetical protein
MKTLAKLLGVVVVATGCVTSEPIDIRTAPDAAGQPIVATGAAGAAILTDQAGTGATAGTSGAAGAVANPGVAGTSGSAGAGSGAAGATAGSTGAAGAAGSTVSGSGGSRDAGTPNDANKVTDAAASEVSASSATWTNIYNKMLNNTAYSSNCAGGGCHNPGTQKSLDLSTQAKGYMTIQTKLVSGSPSTSKVVSVLSSGSMPQGRPKMPAADLNVIKAWITAGAPNN